MPKFNLHEFVPPPEKWKEITQWSPLPGAGWRQLFSGILTGGGEHADFGSSIRAEFMRDLATRLLLPSPSLDTPLPSPWRKPLCGPCTAACMIIVFLSAGRISAFPPVSISSGHPRHAAMSAWTGRVGSGRVGFFVEMRLDSSLSLSLENAQGCRGCLMVLRERRSGLEGWLGERRCGFEARLHEGCDGCVLSRSAISREGWIRPLSSSKIRGNVIIGEEGRSLSLRKLRRLEILLLLLKGEMWKIEKRWRIHSRKGNFKEFYFGTRRGQMFEFMFRESLASYLASN